MLRAIKSTTSSLTPARPGSPCSITPATRVISPAARPTAAARRAAGPSSPPWARRDQWDLRDRPVIPARRVRQEQWDRRERLDRQVQPEPQDQSDRLALKVQPATPARPERRVRQVL